MKLNVDTIYTAAVADEQHQLADHATNGVFGELASSTKGFTDRGEWEKQVRIFEDQYMEATQKSNPDAKTKGTKKKPGRWKYAKFLPKSWSSSKSVCAQAIEHGIKVDETSGKTATEQKIKDAKNALRGEKTPREKFDIAMETANKILGTMPDNERDDALRSYGIDPSNSDYKWGVK